MLPTHQRTRKSFKKNIHGLWNRLKRRLLRSKLKLRERQQQQNKNEKFTINQKLNEVQIIIRDPYLMRYYKFNYIKLIKL